MSRNMSVMTEREGRAQTFEKKSIVSPPHVIKSSPILFELKKYPALTISENINRALEVLSRMDFGCGPICGRKCRETFIEMGVLRERKTFRALEMAEVPENVRQPRSANKRL